ncbi:MAG: hypothetical protein ACLGI3_02720 [Actinomycetes bacterium]
MPVPDRHVTPRRSLRVAPVLDENVAGLDPRLSRLLVATRDGDLVGWLLLTGNANPVLAQPVPGPPGCPGSLDAASSRR